MQGQTQIVPSPMGAMCDGACAEEAAARTFSESYQLSDATKAQ